MSTAIRYVAAPNHVREVTLRGTADLAFWKSRLAHDDLAPAVRGNRAELLIIGANMAFMGLRFTELSFSVQVLPTADAQYPNAALLIHAFNTSRMFALCERTFFRTPYYYGDCHVSTSAPVSIQLFEGSKAILQAELRPEAAAVIRQPSRSGNETWQGPIYLPRTGSSGTSGGYMFYGKMEGHTDVYPFRPDLDQISILPSPNAKVLQDLIDSDFQGKEWIVRQDGTHARSKTYPRK